MVGFSFSNSKNKMAESHTEKYPLPSDVIRFLVKEALSRGIDSWCHFDDESESVWAEVAPDKVGLLINRDIESVISFIDDFFKKLSKMGYDYKLSGSVQN